MPAWLTRIIANTPGDSAPEAAGWNFKYLLCALFIAFVIQSIVLPCLCHLGDARMRIAFVFDGLIILRMVIARVFRERGEVWVFYLLLLYTSPLWIFWAVHH